ncbi:hypothetical protein N0V82_007642 [Gnomoniopsis sp. IMI 355080]|nr:hypothetical protein N0V82_007642 [Gnomoniopsis sp. IMI 355080]
MSLLSHNQALLTSLATVGLSPGSTDLIPSDFKPTTELHVRFGDRVVALGSLLRASECKCAPDISFSVEEADGPSSETNYTLLLVDPDAPTPDEPKFAFWRHWIVCGLRPANSTGASTSKHVLTEYLGPGPKDE